MDSKRIPDLPNRRSVLVREFFAEFFGTFFIMCIGNGAIANYVLNQNNKTGVDHFAVCFAFGVGVLIGVSIAANISGAHLNPAITIALASLKKFPLKKIPLFLLAQYLGAFMAAFAIYGAYYEGIEAYDNGNRTAYPQHPHMKTSTGAIFSTYPADHVSLFGSLVDQILATFLLMFAIMAITDEKGINTPKHMQPTVLALVITGICIAFGLNCGAILNPARDFAPRVFQVLAGYKIMPFQPINSLYWLSAGIIGPHIGAIIGAWAYKLTLSCETDNENTNQKLSPIYISDDNKSPNNDSFRHKQHRILMDELENAKPLMAKFDDIDDIDEQTDLDKDFKVNSADNIDKKNSSNDVSITKPIADSNTGVKTEIPITISSPQTSPPKQTQTVLPQKVILRQVDLNKQI